MVWEETEPGVWHDDYDGVEKVFYGMSKAFEGIGKEHASVYSVCKIGLRDPTSKAPLEALLRCAWRALRFDFPALSVVAEGSKKRYQTATAEQVDHWVAETFFLETVRPASEVVPSLHLRKLPSLIFLPSTSEIIFQCSHWRIDALGTCMILDRLFDLVSQGASIPTPPWELEYQNLSPSLEDAFGSPKIHSPTMEAKAESIRKRNFESAYPSTGLPFNGDTSTEPTLSRTKAMEFTTEATKDLIATCKAHAISLTAAIHAACAAAVFDLSKQNDHDYSTVVSANVRDHLPQSQDGTKKAYSCGTYVTGIMHTVRRTDDFATRCAKLTKGYRGDWEPKEYMMALRPIYKVHSQGMLALAGAGTRPPASNVTVSSLGLVEKYLSREHGDVVVEGFRLGSAVMTRQPTLYIWTFGGRLTVSVDFNEAYYGGDALVGLLESMRGCLERELKVTLDVVKETSQ